MSTSAALRFCDGGGWLVGLERPFPEQPFMFYEPRFGTRVGCNSVRCSRCGERVMSAVGRLPGAGVEASELWEAPSLADLTTREEDPQVHRLYFCRCSGVAVPGSLSLDPDRREPTDPDLPWECAGHPVPELPVEIDGVVLGAQTDFEELVRGVESKGPPAGSWEEGRAGSQWLRRVYFWLDPMGAGARVAEAYAAMAMGDSVPERSDGLYFHSIVPDARTSANLLARGAAAPELFWTQPDGWDSDWLMMDRYGDFVALQLQRSIELGEAPTALALSEGRRLAQAGCQAKQLYVALAFHDADWLEAHAVDAAGARSGTGPIILSALALAPTRLAAVAPWAIHDQRVATLKGKVEQALGAAGD